jgi:hypothetical protein
VEGIEKPWILSGGEVNKIKTNKKVKNLSAKLLTAFGIMVLILAVPLTALAEDAGDPASSPEESTQTADSTVTESSSSETGSTGSAESGFSDDSTTGSDSETNTVNDSESSNDSTPPPADEAPASEGSEGDTTGQDSGDNLPEPQATGDSEVTSTEESSSDAEPAEPVSSDDGDSEPDGTEGDLVETNAESDAGNSYIATITPDAVVKGGTIPADYSGYKANETGRLFTITFKEVGDKVIGSAQVKMPILNGDDGFKGYNFDPSTDIATSSNQSWSGELELVVNAGLSLWYLNLWAQSDADYLNPGESVSATFTATTPNVNGLYVFETKAWTNAAEGFDGIGFKDNSMAAGYIDPSVVVGTGVGTPTDLNNVRNNLGGHYVQTDDIDLNVVPYNTDSGWSPIGINADRFAGSYNGDNKTISGLYINRSDPYYIGLFGVTDLGADLRNIKLVDVNITGLSGVGGLVGVNYGAITNSYATGTVTGNNYVGGLVGYNHNGPITDSYATGTVTGNNINGVGVGGLVGRNEGTITGSHAEGAVDGNNSVGGLVGWNNGASATITDSHAKNSVVGKEGVGGLVGVNSGGKITSSYAEGTVKGENKVGGLIGHNHTGGEITNSYATGNVTQTGVSQDYSVGGLVGQNGANSTIKNSYATGNVEGKEVVGGLVGYNSGTITNNYATGNVTQTSTDGLYRTVGGLVGYNYGTITDSYATGAVIGTVEAHAVGGLVGLNIGTISNCYATGEVTGPEDKFGGLVGFSDGTITNCYWNTDSLAGPGIGDGTGDATGKPLAEILTLGFHRDTLGWGAIITTTAATVNRGGYDPYPFPRLFWELGSENSPIWYIYQNEENGDDANEPISFFGGFDFFFTFPPTLPLSPTGNLTNIPRQTANVLITPAFVTGGSATDLNRAITAYNQAMQSYEANYGTMSAVERAVAEVELAVAGAAIKALQLSLAARSGAAVELTELLAAYQAAQAALNSNRGLLSADQVTEAQALLDAIVSVISRFST